MKNNSCPEDHVGCRQRGVQDRMSNVLKSVRQVEFLCVLRCGFRFALFCVSRFDVHFAPTTFCVWWPKQTSKTKFQI